VPGAEPVIGIPAIPQSVVENDRNKSAGITMSPVSPSVVDTPQAIPSPSTEPNFVEVTFDELPVDAVEIIEDLEILPDEAVAVVSELSGRERASHDKLGIELLGESKFKGGERKTVSIMVCRGHQRRSLAARK
jgi:hypothetical protein